MDRIYLIIFLVMVGAFIYWYQKNVLQGKFLGFGFNFGLPINKKHRKHHKKGKKKSKSRKKKKSRRHNETETEGQIDTESTDSRIRNRQNKVRRAYNNPGNTEDSISLDSLSMGNKSMGSSGSDDISLDSASSSDFLSRG